MQKACTCAPATVTKYQKRISGPLLDRIDIHIEVLRVDYEKLSGDRLCESSNSIRERVQKARDIQNQRYSNIEASNIVCNADMRVGEIRQFCRLQDESQSLMRAAMSQITCQREPITASWSWHAWAPIWQGVMRSNPHIWRRLSSIAQSWWWDNQNPYAIMKLRK